MPIVYSFTFCNDYVYILLFDIYSAGRHTVPVPCPSENMQIKMTRRIRDLFIRKKELFFRINKLEPVASAMSRDNTDSKHLSLSHCFQEHIRNSKSELSKVNTELHNFRSLVEQAP
jgi:hypothetical protein